MVAEMLDDSCRLLDLLAIRHQKSAQLPCKRCTLESNHRELALPSNNLDLETKFKFEDSEIQSCDSLGESYQPCSL